MIAIVPKQDARFAPQPAAPPSDAVLLVANGHVAGGGLVTADRHPVPEGAPEVWQCRLHNAWQLSDLPPNYEWQLEGLRWVPAELLHAVESTFGLFGDTVREAAMTEQMRRQGMEDVIRLAADTMVGRMITGVPRVGRDR